MKQKTIIYSLAVLSFTIMSFVPNSQNESTSLNLANGVTLRCKGNCPDHPISNKCGIESAPGGGLDVQCTCDNCSMIIVFDDKEKVVSENELGTLLNDKDLFLNLLSDYIQEHYNQSYIISSMEVRDDASNPNNYSVGYTFILANKQEGSVLYARNSGKTFEVDCAGTCDCRERYVFSEPPAVECSCDECKMTVKEIISNE